MWDNPRVRVVALMVLPVVVAVAVLLCVGYVRVVAASEVSVDSSFESGGYQYWDTWESGCGCAGTYNYSGTLVYDYSEARLGHYYLSLNDSGPNLSMQQTYTFDYVTGTHPFTLCVYAKRSGEGSHSLQLMVYSFWGALDEQCIACNTSGCDAEWSNDPSLPESSGTYQFTSVTGEYVQYCSSGETHSSAEGVSFGFVYYGDAAVTLLLDDVDFYVEGDVPPTATPTNTSAPTSTPTPEGSPDLKACAGTEVLTEPVYLYDGQSLEVGAIVEEVEGRALVTVWQAATGSEAYRAVHSWVYDVDPEVGSGDVYLYGWHFGTAERQFYSPSFEQDWSSGGGIAVSNISGYPVPFWVTGICLLDEDVLPTMTPIPTPTITPAPSNTPFASVTPAATLTVHPTGIAPIKTVTVPTPAATVPISITNPSSNCLTLSLTRVVSDATTYQVCFESYNYELTGDLAFLNDLLIIAAIAVVGIALFFIWRH